MSAYSLRYRVTWISLLALACLGGCDRRDVPAETRPLLKLVPCTDSDLAVALGVDMCKFGYSLGNLDVPQGKLVYYEITMELFREDERIRQWTTPNFICAESGSILLAYYTPPVFTNDQETVEAKVVYTAQGSSSMNVSLDMPFRFSGCFSQINEKVIEMDREYVLATIAERFSPYNTGATQEEITEHREESENKALVLKVRFGLTDE